MSDFRNRQSAEILSSVYKNAEMAYESSGEVLHYCKNRRLAREISKERERYRAVASKAHEELRRRGEHPKEYPLYVKAMSTMGIRGRLTANRSSKSVASLMIRGTTMGIIDMQHAVNCSSSAEPNIRSDAQELLEREQGFCEHLKKYL